MEKLILKPKNSEELALEIHSYAKEYYFETFFKFLMVTIVTILTFYLSSILKLFQHFIQIFFC